MVKKHKGRFLKRFKASITRPEMLVLPGQIAFFLFLSIVPTITLLGYFCAYLNISGELVNSFIGNTIGENYASLLVPIISSTKITPSFFILLGVGYFIASNGMSSMIVASNMIYGIKDSGFIKRRFKAVVMEIVIVVLFLFVIIVPLFGNSIIKILHYLNLNVETTEMIVNILRFLKGPFSWLVIFIFVKLLYTMAPDKRIPSKRVNFGALFTTAGWILGTLVYSYYINHIANYSYFYGTLANLVVLMVWIYFLSYIFVIGLAMNYHEELEVTGFVDVIKIIEESANSAPVMTDKDVNKVASKRKKSRTKE